MSDYVGSKGLIDWLIYKSSTGYVNDAGSLVIHPVDAAEAASQWLEIHTVDLERHEASMCDSWDVE